MKLFNRWPRNLAVSFLLVAFSSHAFGQGEAYPVPMDMGPSPDTYGYPAAMTGASLQCDSFCEGDSCGGLGGGLLGCLDSSSCEAGSCGRRGCGCGDGLGNGCGPLGCNGGTFGDGRSLSDLFSAMSGRLGSLTGSLLRPYGEGGVASQRWFDFSAEAIYLTRTHGAGAQNFSSQGRSPTNPSDFVLSSNNVNLDKYRAGLALQGNIQVGPGSNVEVGYFGLTKWRNSATVRSTTPTLYSFLSDFGTAPFDGFDDPDRSFTHTLNYESRVNNGEVNLRRRWAEPSGFLQGSFLAGIRYFQLDEQLNFIARGENNNSFANNGPRFLDYQAKTQNQLTGFQIGGDLWLNIIPGVKVGSELKGGIFGNHATQNTQITANSLPAFGIPSISERASDGRTAYLVQLSTQAIYRLTYAWTLRGSHQLIYVDNVALAPENINRTPPSEFLPDSVRNVSINVDGEVLYSGFTAGAEYTW